MGCVKDLCNQDDNKTNTDPNPAPKPVVKDNVKLRKVNVPAEAHEGEDQPKRSELPGQYQRQRGSGTGSEDI
jgi:hypothetical protein